MATHICFKCTASWNCGKCGCKVCPRCEAPVTNDGQKQSTTFDLPEIEDIPSLREDMMEE